MYFPKAFEIFTKLNKLRPSPLAIITTTTPRITITAPTTPRTCPALSTGWRASHQQWPTPQLLHPPSSAQSRGPTRSQCSRFFQSSIFEAFSNEKQGDFRRAFRKKFGLDVDEVEEKRKIVARRWVKGGLLRMTFRGLLHLVIWIAGVGWLVGECDRVC